jgi:hypothetical protein
MTRSHARPRLLIALAALIITVPACSAMEKEMDTPPESEYTQAEVYAPAEAAVAELVEVLPDFPGFAKRSWGELPCSHNGVDDPGYTMVEIRYQFSAEDSATPLVNEQYVDILREHWTSLGYEISRDDSTEGDGGVYRDLKAITADGVSIWYSAAYLATFMVSFGGCVPVSEPGSIAYIPPSGGIKPGSEGDAVGDYFPDGIPTQHEAIAPFESPESYDGDL